MIEITRLWGNTGPEIDCGVAEKNEFLRSEALYAQSHGISATHVAVAPPDRVVGFVTLAMASVRFEAHERPDGADVGSLPALLVAQLGVDVAKQGEGIGKLLMRFALGIAQSLRHSIGCRYLVVDCLPSVVLYYQRMGFEESKGERRRRKDEIKRAGRPEAEVSMRLAKDIATGVWLEVDVAPPHVFATELHQAASDGDIGLLTALLKAGVAADIRSGRGDDGVGVGATALHVAAGRGQIGAIRTLVSAGADINAADGDCETPLHWAVRHGQELSVAALLVAGADPNIEGGNGILTPLGYALHPRQERSQIAELLRQAGGVHTVEGELIDDSQAMSAPESGAEPG